MSKLPENTEYIGAVGSLITVEINGKKYVILQKRASHDTFPGCLQVTVHGGLEGKNRAERETLIDGLKREVCEEVKEMLNRSPSSPQPKHCTAIGNTLLINMDPERAIRMIKDVGVQNPDIEVMMQKNTLEALGVLGVKRKKSQEKRSLRPNMLEKIRYKLHDIFSFLDTYVPIQPIPTRKTTATLGYNITEENISSNPGVLKHVRTLEKDGVVILLSIDEIGKLVPLNPKLHKKDGITEKGKYGMFQDEIDAVKKIFDNNAIDDGERSRLELTKQIQEALGGARPMYPVTNLDQAIKIGREHTDFQFQLLPIGRDETEEDARARERADEENYSVWLKSLPDVLRQLELQGRSLLEIRRNE